MIPRWAKTPLATSIGVLATSIAIAVIAACCSCSSRSKSRTPAPWSIPSSARIPLPSRVRDLDASVPPSPSDSGAPASPSSEGKCEAGAPMAEAAFTPVTLRFEQSADAATTVEPEVARRFPVISDDGRTIATLDQRWTIEEEESLHLVLLDVRTSKPTVFTLWRKSGLPTRRPQAQRALDRARWQSLIPGVIGGQDCGLSRVAADPHALRFNGVEFQFGGDGAKVELLRRTRAGDSKVPLVVQGRPGRMGQAAVPTQDVGLPCGVWDRLEAAWVSHEGSIYLFKLGGTIGARCGTPPTPVEYSSWVSP